MERRTPSHKLADLLLGGEGALRDFVTTRRTAGRPWRLIARDLLNATDGQLDLTHETLRNWFPDEPTEAAS